MATRTKAQLSKAVMEKLGLLNATDDVAAEDHAMISTRYTELMEGLEAENLAYWPEDQIPLLVFPAVTDLVGIHCASAFGITPLNPIEIEQAEIIVKRRIRKYTVTKSSLLDTYQADY